MIQRLTHIFVLALTLSGLSLVAPGAALAQGGVQAQVLRELERTEALIERALEVVSQAISDRPREVLSMARDMQLEARGHFHAQRFQQALARTRLAREAAGRAVELATAELRLLEQVRQLIAENHDLSARARDVVAASDNPEARRLLEAGLGQLRRGQRAFHDHQFRAAIRLSLFGRDLVQRAVRTAEGDGGLDEARVREELSRTTEFLREADSASPGPGKRRLEEARRLQERAERELRRRQLARARRLTLRARELVLDVLRSESGTPGAADVAAHLERVEARYRRVAEQTRAEGDERARRMLGEARDHLDEARKASANDELRRALAEAQLANSLLDQVESR